MISIIDADSLIWVAAYHNRDNPNPDDAINSIDSIITEILIATKATSYIGFIQGINWSFREKMFSDYKANRPPKPIWLIEKSAILKRHMVEYWQFYAVQGVESDDAAASAARTYHKQGLAYTVCGNDKDLNQIPGWHYDPQKKLLFGVSQDQSNHSLLTQLVMGDRTDNISGIPGVGPKTAEKFFKDHREDPSGMACIALMQYYNHHDSFLPTTLIDFAENVIKVTLKTDLPTESFIPVPDSIQQMYKLIE